jgi:lysylphosphatidylglycerol synthetase-like protein (DUF2156 family)
VEDIRTVLESKSDNPSAFLALNEGNSHFTVPDVDGVVTYREAGRRLVQFGGPVGDPAVLRRFTEYARSRRRKVVAIQVQAHDVPVYEVAGYTVNQVGASYAVDLARFTLRGKKFVRLRNKVARATRSGLLVKEVAQQDWHDRMKALDAIWLRSKGKHAKELRFLVGEYGGPHQDARRLFIGTIDGELAGYVSYSPAYGSRPGWLHDLSRRLPDGPPGVMEAVNSTAIETFQSEGAEWLHFGFTPFTGLAKEFDTTTQSGWFAWLVRQLAARGAAVYPAATQLAYKQKWAPHAIIPEYIAFQNRANPYSFLQVFNAANAL